MVKCKNIRNQFCFLLEPRWTCAIVRDVWSFFCVILFLGVVSRCISVFLFSSSRSVRVYLGDRAVERGIGENQETSFLVGCQKIVSQHLSFSACKRKVLRRQPERREKRWNGRGTIGGLGRREMKRKFVMEWRGVREFTELFRFLYFSQTLRG